MPPFVAQLSGRQSLAHQPQADRSTSCSSLVRCICDPPAPGSSKGPRKGNRENNANNILRPSDSPLTEYEKEQIALRKNLERLKAERLAREAASSKND
jgi:hypothetical protein